MSRIGKQPVEIPNGVKATVSGQTINVEGPKGKLSMDAHNMMKMSTAEILMSSFTCFISVVPVDNPSMRGIEEKVVFRSNELTLI